MVIYYSLGLIFLVDHRNIIGNEDIWEHIIIKKDTLRDSGGL